jgi:hypothetical protein
VNVLLLHAAEGGVSRTGEIAMTVVAVGVLALVWTTLGAICWIFWRAKKRDDAAKERAAWPNAPSS